MQVKHWGSYSTNSSHSPAKQMNTIMLINASIISEVTYGWLTLVGILTGFMQLTWQCLVYFGVKRLSNQNAIITTPVLHLCPNEPTSSFH
jgi:hypothetical protein